MIKTDILIIGAGPTGLFAVLKRVIKIKCHILDALPQVGGQLSELYPKSPSRSWISRSLVGDLVGN
jgi:thioredoxin reductase (NADPH)